MRIFFVFFILTSSLQTWAQTSAQTELQTYFDQVVADVQTKLPPSARDALKGKFRIRLAQLNKGKTPIELTCHEPIDDESIDTTNLHANEGVHSKKSRSSKSLIEIDKGLAERAFQNLQCPKTNVPVRYYLEQAIIHEMAHAYDFLPYADRAEKKLDQYCDTKLQQAMHANGSKNNKTIMQATSELEIKCQAHLGSRQKSLISDSIIFEEIINYRGKPTKGHFLNEKPDRSLMAYEYTNAAEFFAVNFARWVLDSDYACRRPRLNSYFVSRFSYDPYPNKTCETNYNIVLPINGPHAIREVSPERVYRIDYMLADPGKGIQSRFGHTMFRVVVCAPERFDPILNKTYPETPLGPDCLKDEKYHIVFSFFGGVGDVKISLLKGLLGGYPSYLIASDLTPKVEEYTRYEFRDLKAYPLRFSEEQKKLFLQSSFEFYWQYSGNYKFLTSNCATEALRLIRSSLGNFEVDNWKLLNENSLFPVGILDLLKEYKLVSKRSSEVQVYASKKNLFNIAFKESAYFYPSARKLGMEFYNEVSTATRTRRLEKLETFVDVNRKDFNLEKMKKTIAALLVIEQHARNLLAIDLHREVTTYLVEQQDSNAAFAKEVDRTFDYTFNRNFTNKGYGLPFWSEIEKELEKLEQQRKEGHAARNENAEIKEKFAASFRELEQIDQNLIQIKTVLKGLLLGPKH